MPTKTGVCINYGGNCTKAKNKELQEAEINNFICSECQQPLLEKRGGGKGEKNKNKRGLLLVIIACVIVIVILLLAFGPQRHNKFPKGSDGIDTTKVELEDNSCSDTTIVESENDDDSIPSLPKVPNYIDLGYARYEGPITNGKPHGVGGELTITGYHVFDLKDSNGSAIEVNAGDMIKNCKFKNGKFVQGFLHRQDGTQTIINIGI